MDKHVNSDDCPLRQQRFFVAPKLTRSFSDGDSNDRRLISEWQRRHGRMPIDDKLEAAAKGIVEEGMVTGETVEAEKMAAELRAVKGGSKAEIEKMVLSLYTRESFLYRAVNGALRDNDRSKCDTLGAFSQLLYHCDCSSTFNELGYKEELYRGAQLDQHTVESYQQAVGQVKTWDGFSSTSKNRIKAELFGNVLFIINRSTTTKYRFSGMDISSLSAFPQEEEVLIRAARNFLVEKVEKNENTGKYYIFLLLC